MEPIISPWLIYFIGIADSLKETFEALTVISLIGLVISVVGVLVVKYCEDFDDEFLPMWRKIKRVSLFLFIPFVFLYLFIPSRNTIIGMVVVKHITSDNVTALVDAGKDVKDELKADIVEIIESITRKEKDE